MWWEVIAEVAYNMALDCGQGADFFDFLDEISKHHASQKKASSQTAMSTLLGNDWRTIRKRGRDPIGKISRFNGLLDEDGNEQDARPESVLVKRSKPVREEFPVDMSRQRELSPISILKNTPVSLEDQSVISPQTLALPVKNSEIPRHNQQIQRNRSSKATKTTQSQQAIDVLFRSSSKSPDKRKSPLDDIPKSVRKLAKDDLSSDEKTPSTSFVKPGKPGLAEKKQKAKKRHSSGSKPNKEYVVERLKDIKMNETGELVYLVAWEGHWDDTWEPFHCVAHLDEDIASVYKNTTPELQAAMRLSGHLEDVESQ